MSPTSRAYTNLCVVTSTIINIKIKQEPIQYTFNKLIFVFFPNAKVLKTSCDGDHITCMIMVVLKRGDVDLHIHTYLTSCDQSGRNGRGRDPFLHVSHNINPWVWKSLVLLRFSAPFPTFAIITTHGAIQFFCSVFTRNYLQGLDGIHYKLGIIESFHLIYYYNSLSSTVR